MAGPPLGGPAGPVYLSSHSETTGLGDASPDELIAAMTRYPELIQRPVVIWADRAVIARPPELLLPLLETGRDPAAP
ncbi:MAG: ArsC/Spx/MgsR family protein [Streptosporangiaceae bacterium]